MTTVGVDMGQVLTTFNEFTRRQPSLLSGPQFGDLYAVPGHRHHLAARDPIQDFASVVTKFAFRY